MKFISVLILGLLSFSAYAEKCEGINSCAILYTKLTGVKLTIDEVITDDMSMAVPDTDLTPENVRGEFPNFLFKNVVNLDDKNHLIARRAGEYLTAPIYVVSPNNMPQMINKDGLVTLVYRTKKETGKLVTAKVKSYVSKKKSKIVEFPKGKVVAVCATFENATKAMNEIMKMDK